MLRKDADISPGVKNLLGHTNIETTSRYAHVRPATFENALDGFRLRARRNLGKKQVLQRQIKLRKRLGDPSSIRPKAKLNFADECCTVS